MATLGLSLCLSLIGWLLIAPIAALVPKKKNKVAVIGALDGQYRDNAKYFFLQAAQTDSDLQLAFVTERRDIVPIFRGHAQGILRYPGLRAVWHLARCNVAVVDESSWFRNGRRFLLVRAHVIQMWHGVGCKRIEIDRWNHETGDTAWASAAVIVQLRLLLYRMSGRLARYAAVATTSKFYRDEVFKRAFLARTFPITGYPRNDFALSLNGQYRELAWSNVDSYVKTKLPDWQRSGRKIVLVTPTFRDSGTLPMQLNIEMLRAIDAFCEAYGVEFIFKLHPSERNTDHINGKHFHIYARSSDVYPLLPHIAALVTDYSSISMDFLWVDRPLLFLIPDGDEYVKKDRELQFDPRTMMPGPIVPDWASLLDALLSEWTNDTHAEERAILRRKAFDDLPQSEATSKLIKLMRKKGWVSTARVTDTH